MSQNIATVFTQIQDTQRLVEYWYDDPELYHLALFSAKYLGKTFYDLTNLWKKNNKNGFIKEIKKQIEESENVKQVLQIVDENGINLSADSLNFNENWFDGDDSDMIPIMILLDIIRILSSKNGKFPIANLDPSHFSSVKEDKEHIFPQTPLETGYDIDTLKYYIGIAYECGFNKYEKDRVLGIVERYEKQLLQKESFRLWFNKEITSRYVPINSLGNVCLLQDKVNRSYGNDFFAQKHFDIMQKSANGEYIRPHVLDAFSKVMATGKQREDLTYMQKWTKEDIYARREYIVSQIKKYLEIGL